MIRKGCDAAGKGLACVPAVACRTIEAWALGDLAAVAALIGSRKPPSLPENKRPEDLWGQPRKQDSNHPKVVLARILGRSATQDDLGKIAERASIGTLRGACTLSFEPFASELEAAI